MYFLVVAFWIFLKYLWSVNCHDSISVLLQGKLDPESRNNLIKIGQHLKEELASMEQGLTAIENELQVEGQKIPNLTHPESPLGGEENAALVKQVMMEVVGHHFHG